MPDILGVQSLQDVCMEQFCLHLSELAISSDQIVSGQTPQQEAAPAAGPGAKEPSPSSGHKPPQEETGQPAGSDTPQGPHQEGRANDAERVEQQEQSDAAPVCDKETSGKTEQENEEHRTPSVEEEGISKPSCPTGQGLPEGTGQKVGKYVEPHRKYEVRTYLLRNVPPCFFEQLVHKTLTIINKYFYNPKYKSRRPAMVAMTGWLLGDHVRHLSLDQCRMLCDRVAVPHVFRCLQHMPRLQTLAIGRLNFWKIPELSLLPDLLGGLPQLTTLRLEYICLPEMVAGLADKCPQLQELSLKDSEKVTDREVPEIRRCLRLKSLNISGTSVTGAGSWEILRTLPALTWFEHCPFNCNSGPFLFDSREAMLSYIWEFLSPEGRAHSAQLPSVTQEMALPRRRAGLDRAGQADAAAGRDAGVGGAGAADVAEVEGGAVVAELEAASADAELRPPDDTGRPGGGAAPSDSHQPQGSGQGADLQSSRESSVGADRSSASSSGRRVSPLPLSRSASGSGCGSPRRLRIENFWLFNPKTEEVALSRLCPTVRLLRLDFVFQDMGRSPELAGLANLRHVTRLEINSFDAPRFSVVSEVLRQLGGQLTELALHVCDDYTATAAVENAVARWCPRLERYSFTGDYSVRLPAERGDEELEFGALRRRHPALRELTLGGFVTGRRLLFVLAQAAGLRRLRLDGELRYLDDAGFRQVLAANPLHQLQELWVNCSTALTLQALLPLLFESQCALRRLGRLSSLQGLNRAGFIELRQQVRSLNLDLELVWVTPGV